MGKLIYDSPVTPIVLPIHITGFEKVMPLKPIIPFPRVGKSVSVTVGEPLDFGELVQQHRQLPTLLPPRQAYAQLTMSVEQAMRHLEAQVSAA